MEIHNTKWRYYIYMVKDTNFEHHFVVYSIYLMKMYLTDQYEEHYSILYSFDI